MNVWKPWAWAWRRWFLHIYLRKAFGFGAVLSYGDPPWRFQLVLPCAHVMVDYNDAWSAEPHLVRVE